MKNFLFTAAIAAAVLFLIIRVMKLNRVTKPLKRRGCDSGGCGHFGATRAAHPGVGHQGRDFLVNPGDPVFAPLSGVVRTLKPYADDNRFDGVEIVGSISVKVMYFLPNVTTGQHVTAGQLIGYAQDLGIKYGSKVPNHLHVEVRFYKGGKPVNPDPFFPSDDILPNVFA